ncbi:MAG: hypothetical protein MPJ50_05380 [Pirellulales bacterium]|nr:hypothetical protein [Pirellulales bacterium]
MDERTAAVARVELFPAIRRLLHGMELVSCSLRKPPNDWTSLDTKVALAGLCKLRDGLRVAMEIIAADEELCRKLASNYSEPLRIGKFRGLSYAELTVDAGKSICTAMLAHHPYCVTRNKMLTQFCLMHDLVAETIDNETVDEITQWTDREYLLFVPPDGTHQVPVEVVSTGEQQKRPRGRPRLKKNYLQKLRIDFEGSGMSQAAFARDKGIPKSTLQTQLTQAKEL